MVRPPYGLRPAAAALALAITSLGLSARGAESSSPILLLDFWSPQCGPCMGMKPTMHALEQAHYPIREVDTTRDPQTSQQFQVTGIPCFIMLVDGQEVDREVGATSSEHLQQMFDKAKEIYVQRHHMRGQSPDPGTVQAATGSGLTSAGPAPNLGASPQARNDVGRMPPASETPNIPIPVTQSSSADFPSSLMKATVRIRVEDNQGRSFGTGTIIDSRSGEALIVTCGHLFRESKGKGPMTIETFDVGQSGPQVSGQFPGQLISFDLERDVAFVSFKPDRQVSIAPVAPAHAAIQKGDRVATIGCSNGQDPTLLPQRVNAIDHYQGPSNIEVSGAPEQGRSGGGLFNLQGQLIGVCYAADYEGREGLYAGLDSVHGELDRLGLKEIYAKNDTSPKSTDIAKDVKATGQPLVRLQEPKDPIAPFAGATPPATPESSPATPQILSQSEQAAFGEIMNRSSSSEVVVIVRPKTPGGQSEIITLDNASPEFIRALEARKRGTQTPIAK